MSITTLSMPSTQRATAPQMVNADIKNKIVVVEQIGENGGGGGNQLIGGQRGGQGGQGGGILFLAANQINWAGTISWVSGMAEARAAMRRVVGWSGGTSGSKGRRSASAGVSRPSVGPALGRPLGGVGLIAFYYQNSIGTIISSPAVYETTIYREPLPTPTPIAPAALPWGSGTDGDLSVAIGSTYNMNTQNSSSHNCMLDGGDAVSYLVTSLTVSYAVLASQPTQGCLMPNDELLLINLQGSSASTVNVGNYEFLRVSSVVGSTVYFGTPKVRFYGEGQADDSNIGTGTGQQSVIIQRVPNYGNVTVNGTLTANSWNGSKGGVVAFRVNGTLSGSGTIAADALGYVGGAGTTLDGTGDQGESYGGVGTSDGSANLGGGGGGSHHSGGGGGYGSVGISGSVAVAQAGICTTIQA